MVGSADGGGSFVQHRSRLAACCPRVAQVEHARHELARPRRLCCLWREVVVVAGSGPLHLRRGRIRRRKPVFITRGELGAAAPDRSSCPRHRLRWSFSRCCRLLRLVLASHLLRQLVARPSTSTSWLDPSPPGHRLLRAVPEPAGSSSSRAGSWSTLSSKFSATGSPSSRRRYSWTCDDNLLE